jgi:hypothetical protein
MEDIRHSINDFIDKKMRKADRYRALCQLEDDIYDAIKFIDSKEQKIRKGTGDWDLASFTGIANIVFCLKENVVHDAILQEEVNTLWPIVQAKGAFGAVLPKHTELLIRSCQYILANENKEWFSKARVAKLAKDWWNSMDQLGEMLKPHEEESVHIKALVDAIRRVNHALT